MRKLVYVVIIVFLIGLTPVIPFEEEIQSGVTAVSHKSIAEWAYTKYQDVQSQKEANHVQLEVEKGPVVEGRE